MYDDAMSSLASTFYSTWSWPFPGFPTFREASIPRTITISIHSEVPSLYSSVNAYQRNEKNKRDDDKKEELSHWGE